MSVEMKAPATDLKSLQAQYKQELQEALDALRVGYVPKDSEIAALGMALGSNLVDRMTATFRRVTLQHFKRLWEAGYLAMMDEQRRSLEQILDEWKVGEVESLQQDAA